MRGVNLSLGIRDRLGSPLLTFPTFLTTGDFALEKGTRTVELLVPKLPLTPGFYVVGLYAATEGGDADFVRRALLFQVRGGDYFGRGMSITNSLKGRVVLCEHRWNTEA